jgi:hypothetical protein
MIPRRPISSTTHSAPVSRSSGSPPQPRTSRPSKRQGHRLGVGHPGHVVPAKAGRHPDRQGRLGHGIDEGAALEPRLGQRRLQGARAVIGDKRQLAVHDGQRPAGFVPLRAVGLGSRGGDDRAFGQLLATERDEDGVPPAQEPCARIARRLEPRARRGGHWREHRPHAVHLEHRVGLEEPDREFAAPAAKRARKAHRHISRQHHIAQRNRVCSGWNCDIGRIPLGPAAHSESRAQLRLHTLRYRDLEWHRHLRAPRPERRLANEAPAPVARLDDGERVGRQSQAFPVRQVPIDHADAVLRRGAARQHNRKGRGKAAPQSSDIPHHGFPLFVVPRDT